MCIDAITIFNNSGNIKGNIKFHQCDDSKKTKVTFNIKGLKPNKMSACHIHEFGDESDGCASLGGHWNPHNTEHGHCCESFGLNSPSYCSDNSHAGDLLNNIHSDSKGYFNYEYMDSRIQIMGDVSESIIGRSVVIHDGIDDLGLGNNKDTKITGNAGGRIACGIIAHTKSIK